MCAAACHATGSEHGSEHAGLPRLAYEREPGSGSAPLPRGYTRHEPDKTVLYRVLCEHLETFLQEARLRSDTGAGYPRFVENEFRRYLDCAILARGFSRLRCPECGFERFIAFSCKGRICPSCLARRASDIAADLVDRVLPEAPYRQWVLTHPWPARFPMAVDGAHLSEMLRAFLRTLFAFQRLRGRRLGLCHGQTGSVTFIQRFGGILNCNPHFHSLLPDGLFVPDNGAGRLVFVPLPPPTDGDVAALAARLASRLGAIVRRHQERREMREVQPEDEEALVLSSAAEAVQLPLSVPSDPATDQVGATGSKPLCARVEGFSLHAARWVAAEDRAGLGRLCSYGLRAPFALDRFSILPDGRVSYRLRKPWPTPDGRTHIVLEPLALLRRLAALIPAPYQNMIRRHGCFANRSRWRHLLPPPPQARPSVATPGPDPAAAATTSTARASLPSPETDAAHPASAVPVPTPPAVHPPIKPSPRRRLPWAQLLRRVLHVDALSCPRCSTPMVVLALISDPDVVKRILDHLGLQSTAPPLAPPRSLFVHYQLLDPPPDDSEFDLSHRQPDSSRPAGPHARIRAGHGARPP